PPKPAAPRPASPTTSAPATGSPTCRSGARAATSSEWHAFGHKKPRVPDATKRSGKGGAPDRRVKEQSRRAGAPPFPRERPSGASLHSEHSDRPVLLQHGQPDLVDRRHAVVPHRFLEVVEGQVGGLQG